ncbi:hypothetical protein [Rouxiella sp. WC2420]|uniref:Ig-like domain-containing protein n=1 Tax=Rouxiella sp. WC2420 TaxID=3234145 RepID=A0AB39VNI0_9GAMM
MFKSFFYWLKSLYYTPANANENTTEEEITMSELAPNVSNATVADATPAADATAADTASVTPVTDVASANAALAAASTDTSSSDTESASSLAQADASSPLDDFKAKAQAFVEFVEKGIEVLGQEAEAELVALKEKYF